jgi:hypothetical protein
MKFLYLYTKKKSRYQIFVLLLLLVIFILIFVLILNLIEIHTLTLSLLQKENDLLSELIRAENALRAQKQIIKGLPQDPLVRQRIGLSILASYLAFTLPFEVFEWFWPRN